MTDREINKAVATALGWRLGADGKGHPPNGMAFMPMTPPDYCNDSNALSQLYKRMDKAGILAIDRFRAYFHKGKHSVNAECTNDVFSHCTKCFFEAMSAPPRVICEAFLVAIDRL